MDAMQAIEQGTARAAELQRLIAAAEADALAMEAKARELRLQRSEYKRELAELGVVLRSNQAQLAVERSQAEAKAARDAAVQSQQDAEALLARLAEKEKQLDEKLKAE